LDLADQVLDDPEETRVWMASGNLALGLDRAWALGSLRLTVDTGRGDVAVSLEGSSKASAKRWSGTTSSVGGSGGVDGSVNRR
jgi:hypothetical protein